MWAVMSSHVLSSPSSYSLPSILLQKLQMPDGTFETAFFGEALGFLTGELVAELELDIVDTRRVGFLLVTFRFTGLERSFFLGGEARSLFTVEAKAQLRVDFRFLVCTSQTTRFCLRRVFMIADCGCCFPNC